MSKKRKTTTETVETQDVNVTEEVLSDEVPVETEVNATPEEVKEDVVADEDIEEVVDESVNTNETVIEEQKEEETVVETHEVVEEQLVKEAEVNEATTETVETHEVVEEQTVEETEVKEVVDVNATDEVPVETEVVTETTEEKPAETQIEPVHVDDPVVMTGTTEPENVTQDENLNPVTENVSGKQEITGKNDDVQMELCKKYKCKFAQSYFMKICATNREFSLFSMIETYLMNKTAYIGLLSLDDFNHIKEVMENNNISFKYKILDPSVKKQFLQKLEFNTQYAVSHK